MDLILGVDGGQSSTVALLATAEGRILGVGAGGPANHIHEPGGLQRMEQSLRDAVRSAFTAAGLAPQPVLSACFGMTGGMEWVPEIAARFLDAGYLIVHHDVVTALAGASRGQAGVLVISGTGAIAYGQAPDGRSARADGAGYLMGDEGSGYWMGVQALRAIARAHDGRGPATTLTGSVPRALDAADFAGVHRAVYSQLLDRPTIAALAVVVSQDADAGDPVACAIVEEAGQRLAESVDAVLRRLALTEPAAYPAGGVLQAGGPVWRAFSASIQSRAPRIRIVAPEYPQVAGALIVARQQIGSPPDAFYALLDSTLPEQVAHKKPHLR